MTCGAYLSATFSSHPGSLVGAFLPHGNHAACGAPPVAELPVQRGRSLPKPVQSRHPPCRSHATPELTGAERRHPVKRQRRPPSCLPLLLLRVQVAKSSLEPSSAASPSVAVDARREAVAPLVMYGASRAAICRPLSGQNHRPECFVQTSTLASSPSQPEPFPSCRRDHVQAHLLELPLLHANTSVVAPLPPVTSLPSTPSAGAGACSCWSSPSVQVATEQAKP
jgi:hypothetical protein